MIWSQVLHPHTHFTAFPNLETQNRILPRPRSGKPRLHWLVTRMLVSPALHENGTRLVLRPGLPAFTVFEIRRFSMLA